MVYVYLADGFEEVEALTAVDVLRRGDVDVQTASITGRKNVCGAHGISVEADILFEDADHDNCEMLVMPGGLPGAEYLQNHAGLKEQICRFAAENRNIAAICAAPMMLGAHGVIAGRSATIYPGMEGRLTGGTATGEAVTIDGNIITGQGPGKAMAFALALVERLKGKVVRDQVAAGLLFE
jgi:4-methyl-5(b-hydroxyethyl)-thiazole monophosphate biosynthesis